MGAVEGVGCIGRTVGRTVRGVRESVLGVGIANDVHAGCLQRHHVVGRGVGVEFADDREDPIGMPGGEMVERFAKKGMEALYKKGGRVKE